MKPLVLPYVYPYSLPFWAVMIWAYWPEFHVIRKAGGSSRQKGSPDAWSLQVIMFGTWIAYFIAIPIAWMPAFRLPASMNLAAFAAGTLVVIAGSLLRRHCFRMLGESFTGDVRARTDQRVVTTGAYALVRHPSYAAGILMHVGFGIALGSWASALVLLVVSFATYRYRIAVEERALQQTIGEPYREFIRTRKRLIPFIY